MGGFVGAIARYGLSGYVHKQFGTGFPYGTLAVNIVGCFFIGALMYFIETRSMISQNLRLFVGIGLLGAFTTFSTFGYETLALMGDRELMRASLNVLGNVILGLFAVWLGRTLLKAIGV
ncbi:MAG: fluoride efflux transporter CrcB [candidate division Zixibacteria bacterium]|nr:fluoride efflux transporter CrcB [candidate division Zixibacteria bacterium]